MLTYTITVSDHCRSLQSFLTNLLPEASRGYLHKLVKAGAVLLDGQTTTPDQLLAMGSVLSLKESDRTRQLLQAPPLPVDILLEDDQLLVLNKRSGIAMHRTAEINEETLVDLATQLMRDRGLTANPRPINRLDRGTSGVVLLAKGAAAAGMFGRHLKDEGFDKLYLAIVGGILPDLGEISSPIDQQDALTRYRTLFRGARRSLVLLAPVTGRTHQIRRHLADAGYPVLGDQRYRGPQLPDHPGFCLHSFRTRVQLSGAPSALTICAPLPDSFLAELRPMAGDRLPELLGQLYDIARQPR
jgi:23S rRNA pseudouridine955/2504/2580 synthase